jgi:hypothetical protein
MNDIIPRGGAWQFARHVGRAALHSAIIQDIC